MFPLLSPPPVTMARETVGRKEFSVPRLGRETVIQKHSSHGNVEVLTQVK